MQKSFYSVVDPFELLGLDGLEIFSNGSGELFVRNPDSRVEIRISKSGNSIIFTSQALVTPIRISNMIGWKIGE